MAKKKIEEVQDIVQEMEKELAEAIPEVVEEPQISDLDRMLKRYNEVDQEVAAIMQEIDKAFESQVKRVGMQKLNLFFKKLAKKEKMHANIIQRRREDAK